MDIDKGKVKQEAKEILDKFAKALEKVEKEKVKKSLGEGKKRKKSREEKGKAEYAERGEFERNEGNGENCNFKEELLKNAPFHDDDFIIAEKGEWK